MSGDSNSPARVEAWGEANLLEPVAGLERWTIAAERSMVMRCRFDQGCVVPEHSHPQEQMTLVLEGELEFTFHAPGAESSRQTAAAGDVVVIPGGLLHEARARTSVLSVDVFTPIRDELLPPSARH